VSNFPAVFLASGFALADDDVIEAARLIGPAQREAEVHYGHLPPNPDDLGGAFNFNTLTGATINEQAFKGHWTLLYFGYARCTDSCPMAIPIIAQAAKELRESGVETRSVFVDIEAAAIGNVRRRARGDAAHPVHLHEVDRSRALRALQTNFGADIQILTGSRGQLSAATAAFMVAREHIPPRDGERGHSINHSSLIYMLDPKARVAGYGYHTSTPKILVETVKKLCETRS
jgi:protein SCO1